ncbi:S-adenosyl-methyltransferase (modular protein) [Cupriavidus taiwanensis]|nr:S-adenosyl-methyltransferase (modular protein) [Cupriavidus taiwanensis]SOY55241.1 S-adenosyl-methyltransferase (modular protein) [Cupriavidus taiwanensis]SOY89307.1 S-adenosyl-methyltransferase (modular protein) [Cupriavidus taiwanensis]SOZ61518.1 S-adenosyl-methyltransferase (modular protein) [Cupriavidus taiwanensis]SOZ81569.1 S-adenosyl-methyltransferase (modular protein) [Cupriavidus taiwanensis]
MTTIPLGRLLPAGSSSLPADSAGRFIACLFGIAPGGGYRVSPFPPGEPGGKTRLCGPIPHVAVDGC